MDDRNVPEHLAAEIAEMRAALLLVKRPASPENDAWPDELDCICEGVDGQQLTWCAIHNGFTYVAILAAKMEQLLEKVEAALRVRPGERSP
jgi:hypothetical protein